MKKATAKSPLIYTAIIRHIFPLMSQNTPKQHILGIFQVSGISQISFSSLKMIYIFKIRKKDQNRVDLHLKKTKPTGTFWHLAEIVLLLLKTLKKETNNHATDEHPTKIDTFLTIFWPHFECFMHMYGYSCCYEIMTQNDTKFDPKNRQKLLFKLLPRHRFFYYTIVV